MAESAAQARSDAGKLSAKQVEELRGDFRAAAAGKPCAVCGKRMFVKAHHVVYQQVIRRICATLGLDPDRWLWDIRNCLPVCKVCHDRHHGGQVPILRTVIVGKAPAAYAFARELGPDAEAQLQRVYPMPARKR